MNVRSLRLSTRLFAVLGTVVMLSLASNGYALYELGLIQSNLKQVVTETGVKTALNNDMAESVHVVSRIVRMAVLVSEPQEKLAEQTKLAAARQSYDKARAELSKFTPSEKGRAIRAEIDAATEKARAINNRVMELGMAGKVADATRLLITDAAPAVQSWQDAIHKNVKLQEASAAENYASSQAEYASARTMLIGGALLSAVLAIVLAVVVVRSVVAEIGGEPADVATLARAIAGSDLTTHIGVKPGDTQSVVAAMAKMQASLSSIVTAVRGNADSVATASAQIAQGNLDLSSRTEQQASALQQTAASMEELGSTVTQNAGNARQANQLAMGASSVALKGGEVVAQVVGTMKGINDSSKRIVDIISVIDGIAFQTNILALNAAVEAARAGEQGRGFAVVAGEVRSLAQRSAAAAKEIKGLITDSVERVEQGTVLSDQAGITMTEIVTSIQRVTDIMGEISTASTEQATGVAQVGEAVTQMDQATQQNSALVEESAAAAESLKVQALALSQAVSVFKLGSGDGRTAGSPPAAIQSSYVPAMPKAIERRTPDQSRKPAKPLAPRPAASSAAHKPAPAKELTESGPNDWESF